MPQPVFSLDFGEHTHLAPGKLLETVLAYQRERRTGLLQISGSGPGVLILVYVRGQLVTVYLCKETVTRLDPAAWLESVLPASPAVSLRMLALTPQDLRLYKILVEQSGDKRNSSNGNSNIDQQFTEWLQHPVLALARVRWREAGALVLFPGQGAQPEYSLVITPSQVLHSTGGTQGVTSRSEAIRALSLYSSEPGSPAWQEYLLQQAFAGLVSGLLAKFEKLVGRMILNQVVRDVNFKAAANDWPVSLTASNANDQALFSSPGQAAQAYTALLDVILQQFENVLGNAILAMLVREAILRLPGQVRQVISEFQLVGGLSAVDDRQVPTGA